MGLKWFWRRYANRRQCGPTQISDEFSDLSISHLDIFQKLGGRLDGGDQQVIAGASTGDVKQVAFGVIDFLQIEDGGLDRFLFLIGEFG